MVDARDTSIERDPLGRFCQYTPPLQFQLEQPLHVGDPVALRLDLPAPPNGDHSDQAFFYLLAEGQLVGYFNRCSHVSLPLDFDDGRMLDAEGLLICRVHGARFAPEDGAVLMGPAPCGLIRVQCRLLAADLLEVSGWNRPEYIPAE